MIVRESLNHEPLLRTMSVNHSRRRVVVQVGIVPEVGERLEANV